MSKSLILYILFVFIFFSCIKIKSKNDWGDITIEKDYLIRKTWEQKDKLGFYIEKIIAQDNHIPPETFKMIEFSRYTCSIDEISGDTVYFNKKQHGVAWFNTYKNKEIDFYGSLEKNTWYHSIQLNMTDDYFIYIDSMGNLEQYAYNKLNW